VTRLYRRFQNTVHFWWYRYQDIADPALMDVRTGTWEDYKARLAASTRKELVRSRRLNPECTYELIAAPPAGLIEEFEATWKRFYPVPDDVLQDLADKNRKGWLRAGVAWSGGQIVAVHPIERYGRYLRCHAPWYDKDIFRQRSMGHFMWFHLIEWALQDTGTDFIDLGGGPVASLPESSYKRRYLPADLGFRVKVCGRCGFRWLFKSIDDAFVCKHCGKSVGIWKYHARLRFPV
jgi:hypothetical protein